LEKMISQDPWKCISVARRTASLMSWLFSSIIPGIRLILFRGPMMLTQMSASHHVSQIEINNLCYAL
jgi:hypothetical protein